MSEKQPLLQVKDLKQYFKVNSGYTVRAVDGVSFDIYPGETYGLVGESGSGKSTIGRSIIRLYEPTAGQILFDGKDISGRLDKKATQALRTQMQMIFQDPMACLNPRKKVGEIIGEGLDIHHLYSSHAERKEKIDRILAKVGLAPEHADRYPHQFSGGQRQRVGIARALIMDPKLIIADECISALDVSIQAQVVNLMKDIQQETGTAYLFIAHDLSIVRFISDRIGVIYKGDIVEIADAEELFDFPLHPYTRSLISAIPIPDPILEKNKVLFTYDPSVHDYSEEKPELVDIGHNHFVFGNKKEIEEYKAQRETGEPLKSIKILDPNAPEEEKKEAEESIPSTEGILDAPLHDTGNKWYSILSFFLPLLGLIAAFAFRRFNHIRNYKACKKGALIGLATLGAIILFFALMLLFAVI